jgi:LPS O-antigen subunit length determinant protein (WzzB/FepE family)
MKSNEIRSVSKQDNNTDSNTGTRKDKRFLMFYAVSLFSAALILVVLSFLIQQRNSEKLITEFKSSEQLSELTLAQLKQENADLKVTVSELEEKLASANEDLSKSLDTGSALKDKLSNSEKSGAELREALDETALSQQAMILLTQLQRSYYSDDITASRDIVSVMEQEGFAELLPDASTDSFSSVPPSDIYAEIKEALE